MEEEVIHQSAAGYALDALSPEEERAYEAHLAMCPRCQDEVAAFTETAAALAYASPPAGLRPELRARILDTARNDRADVVRLRPRRAYVVAALAAAVACAAAGVGVWVGTGSPSQGFEALVLRGGAKGSVVVMPGGAAALVVSGLPPAPAGKTYEVWVMHKSTALPAGLFTAREQTAVVRLALPLPAGSRVGVTLEPAGGSARPTTAPLLTSSPA